MFSAREMMRLLEGHVVTVAYRFGITAGIRLVDACIQISTMMCTVLSVDFQYC